jgi:hypothetical protein
MKPIAFILCLMFFSAPVAGQSIASAVDSLTLSRIGQCSKSDKRYFNKIISTRKHNNWRDRIDSLKFDYAFVEETYCLKTWLCDL